MRTVLTIGEWFTLGYFITVHGFYLVLDGLAFFAVRRSLASRNELLVYRTTYGLEPPVSVLVPAYNEAPVIVASIKALLQLDYPEFEIVVVNDGSSDDTMEVLAAEFDLVECPRLYQHRLATEPIRGVYVSRANAQLRVVDKANGGKADSLNAALNVAQYPLYCAVDADSILQRDSLLRIVRPFLDDPTTVAAGGTIRILNGSEVSGGFLRTPRLARNTLALLQTMEYLRAFLFGRVGWSPLGGVLIISGAFGVFRRAEVVEMGGYRVGTVGEDAELVMRLHRHCRAKKMDYRVSFVPDPICWTECPEDIRSLARQRIRWQRGLAESLWANRGLMRERSVAGWIAFPFLVVFEALGPIFELGGYAFMLLAWMAGVLSFTGLVAFLVFSIGLGILLSTSALLLEERSFRTYREPSALPRLMAASVVENLGYRQANLVWRLIGLVRFVRNHDSDWGHIRRVSAGADAPAPQPVQV